MVFRPASSTTRSGSQGIQVTAASRHRRESVRQRSDYITLLYDLDTSTGEAISDGNDTDSGIACFSQLSQEQIESIEAMAMDMSAAYVKATK